MAFRSIQLFLFSVFLLSYLLTQFVALPAIFPKGKPSWRQTLAGGLLMAVFIYLLLGDWRGFLVPLGALVVYFVVELIRRRTGKENFRRSLLWLAIWLLVILLAAYALPLITIISSTWLANFGLDYIRSILTLAGLLFAVFQGSQTIGLMLVPFSQEIRKTSPYTGLKDGGKWIGVLERALIFILVLAGQYAAIGFLVAAKSILRFGEVKESANRMEAEYIIIGTLASILFALLCGLATLWLIGQTRIP